MDLHMTVHARGAQVVKVLALFQVLSTDIADDYSFLIM